MPDITSNLISHWTLLDGDLTDHGSAGNHLTNMTAVPFVVDALGRAGSAGEFDNSNEHSLCNVAPHASTPNLPPITVSMWMRGLAYAGTRIPFGASEGGNHWYFGTFSSRRVGFSHHDPALVARLLRVTATAGELPDGEWRYVTATLGVSGLTVLAQVFVNGVLIGTVSHTNGMVAAPPAVPGVRVGAYRPTTSGLNFDGDVADVRLYSRVLTAGDIAAVYAAAATLPPDGDGPRFRKTGTQRNRR